MRAVRDATGREYQLGRTLGKGGFASCYQASALDGSQVVALKVVKNAMPAKVEEKVPHNHIYEYM